jgi:hypothetical protein
MKEKVISVACLLFGIVAGIALSLLVLEKVFFTEVGSYTFDGKKITSEYTVVGSPNDFKVIYDDTIGTFKLQWDAYGKYNYSYCYVIPPLSDFEEMIAKDSTQSRYKFLKEKAVLLEVADVKFDSNCKEVYFSDGCPPVIGEIHVENGVMTNAFISASVTSIVGVYSNNINYASQSHLAETMAIADVPNPDMGYQPSVEIDFPDNIYEVSYLYELGSLKNINFPKNVKNLSFVLNECSKIEKCEISSEELEGIYTSFNDCDSLTEVAITDKTKVIFSSFNRCLKLELVRIPDETVIAGDSFLGCRNLTLSVEKGSSAEAYAIANDIAYEYHTSD